MSLSSDTSTIIVTNPDGIYATTIWFLWYCCRREFQQLFDSNIPSMSSKVIFRLIEKFDSIKSLVFRVDLLRIS